MPIPHRVERLAVREAMSGGYKVLDAALCERACELLDRLRRSVLAPYVLVGSQSNLTQNVVTRMQIDDFKNASSGPLVLTRARFFTTAAVAASATGAVFRNIAVRIVDNDRTRPLTKNETLLAVLAGYNTNTAYLDRPHVVAPDASFSLSLREENAAATTDVFVSLLGEQVAGGLLSGAEVRELIALDLYPGLSGTRTTWAQGLLSTVLFGDDARCSSPAGEQLRWALRMRTAELRLALSRARLCAYTLQASLTDVATNTSSSLPGPALRNDSGFPLAIARLRASTLAAPAATAVGAVFSNISFTVVHSGPNRLLTRTRTIAPCLFDIADNEWVFDRPLILGPDEGLDVGLIEGNVNATTDVYLAAFGEQVQGVSAEELREAASLGIY